MNTKDKRKLLMLSDKTDKALEAIDNNRDDILRLTSIRAEQLDLIIDGMDDLAGTFDTLKNETWPGTYKEDNHD